MAAYLGTKIALDFFANEEHWRLILSIIRRVLLKDIGRLVSNTSRSNQEKRYRKKSEIDEMMAACIRLCALFCNVLQEEAGDVMVNDEDENCVINILYQFLRRGYAEENKEDEGGGDREEADSDSGRNSPYLHAAALKSISWILFYNNNPHDTIEFLQACAKYFVIQVSSHAPHTNALTQPITSQHNTTG